MAIARHPRTRKIAIWGISIIVAFGVLLGLVAPPLLRGKIASELGKKLHREVSIERIKINPYALTLAVGGFVMKERQSQTTAVSFDELYVNLEIQSLFRLAPVLKEIRVVKPYVNLIRHENGKYNYQDIIDEMMAGPPGPTPRFSLNNIQVVDGKIDFDDRPEQTKHVVSAIKIGVPFISSIPTHVEIKVQPAFYALVNDAPFRIDGETHPFKDSRESTIRLKIDELKIPKYFEYSPVELNLKVPSGQLDGVITAAFRTTKDKSSVLSISGALGIKDLRLQEKSDAPLLSLPSFDMVIDGVEVFSKRANLKSIKLESPELHVTKNRDGTLNLTSLVSTPAKEPAPEEKKESAPFAYRVDAILVNQGKLFLTDRSPERPFEKRLENIHVDVKELTNEPEKKAGVETSFESDKKEQFGAKGWLQITPLLAEVEIEVKSLQLKELRPYYESVLGVEITDGLMDLATRVAVAQRENQPLETKLTSLNAALRSLRLDVPGESEPLWQAPLLAIKEAAVDVEKRSIVVGSFESRDGNGFIDRSKDGSISYARLIKTQAGESGTKKPEQENATEWAVEMKRLALDRFRIVFEDRMLSPVVRTTVSSISVRGENLSNAKNSRAKAQIQATINDKGMLRLAGTVGTRPVAGRFNVDAQAIALVPFQPYLADQINFSLTSGEVGSKGILAFDAAGEGSLKVNYEGSIQVSDFASIDKDSSQDLLKWKSLDLGGIEFALQPMQLRINEINLAQFYARLILGADGKINLRNLTVQKSEKSDTGETKPAKPAEPPATLPSSEKHISIGKINLQGGNVNFSDFFIKPNYSANLTGVQGTISELKPDTPGDLDLQARLDNAAPVEIKGKLNPLSKELFLDLVADAKEIELSPMTPYSVKFVGYGIEKGKLSFNVKYKLDNRKLNAENKIILNQLTFGQKIDSPDATNLPVLLAVALLKDRNGIIDIDLPIGGSLDDPQFSVGGIIWQLIVNIITKAITAPFSLLAAAFGGGSGGDELSYIEFDNGRANLNPSAQAKIATLTKALNNRPALNLELSGRVDPLTDLDGLKRVGIERKVKAQKLKDLIRKGEPSRSVDDVQVASSEYPQYLKSAYGEESFPKPRNFIGLAQDLPVPEMEKLMLQNAKAGDDDMRQLANQRAQAVRDALLAGGQVGAERLFIVAAKPLTSDEAAKAKGKPNRVDFAMK